MHLLYHNAFTGHTENGNKEGVAMAQNYLTKVNNLISVNHGHEAQTKTEEGQSYVTMQNIICYKHQIFSTHQK